jgi:hypothetical protein
MAYRKCGRKIVTYFKCCNRIFGDEIENYKERVSTNVADL